MKRKLAEHDNLKIIIEQTGDKFHIKESSTFRTKDIDFTLGVPFDYSLADGTEVSVSALKVVQLYIIKPTAAGPGAVSSFKCNKEWFALGKYGLFFKD